MSRKTEHTLSGGVFGALAEPNRLRIVELLGAAPRSVGEIALRLRLRQPQVTKHLQTLERNGLVAVHPLGKRRIYSLRRETLGELARWLGTFEADHPSEDALQLYEAAIQAEQLRAGLGKSGTARHLEFSRDLHAPSSKVWRAWTSPDEVRQWWAPTHFSVVECTVRPVVGGPLRIVMQEADGARYASAGRFLSLRPPAALSFELAPLDVRGHPLFQAVHDVRLEDRGASTRLSMVIDVTHATPQAATAVAGLQIGWGQLLDKLIALVGADQAGA